MNPPFDDSEDKWREICTNSCDEVRMESLSRAVGLLFGDIMAKMDYHQEEHVVVDLGLLEASIITGKEGHIYRDAGRTATIWLIWMPNKQAYNPQGDDPLMFEFLALWNPKYGIVSDSLTYTSFRMYHKGYLKSYNRFILDQKREEVMLTLEKIIMRRVYVKYLSPHAAHLEECF